MAGIIGIYGLVVSVLISSGLSQQQSLYAGFIQLGAGLSVGLAGLAAGYLRCSDYSTASGADFLQFCYWYRWRCRCPRYCAAAQAVRRHDSDSHFR